MLRVSRIAVRASRLSVLALWSVALFSTNCAKKDSEPNREGVSSAGSRGSLRLGVMAANFRETASASLAPTMDLASGDAGVPPFRATSIFSGAPDSFVVSVKKISLFGKSNATGGAPGAVVNVTVFEDKEGKPIRIDGSSVDLSGLFAIPTCVKQDGTPIALAAGEKCDCGVDAKGKIVKKKPMRDESTGKTVTRCDSGEVKVPPVGVIDVSAGTYTSLEVTYASRSTIKGCLTGYFRTNSTGVGDTSKAHTYCTRQEGSLFTGGPGVTLSTFEDKEAEEMDSPLSGVGGPNPFTADTTDTRVSYPIGAGFKVEEGKAGQLTLVIDTNRMLRFEAANRDDATVLKSGWPKSRPYFFSTVFADSSFAFVGTPGEIRGYAWNAYACTPAVSPCQGTSAAFYIEGWLTSILGTDGKPMILSYMPDDDSTLTVVKGSNLVMTRDANGSVSRSALPDGAVTGADGTLTLKYGLGDSNGTGSITLPREPKSIDESVGGTFAGFRQSGGEFTLTRKL